MEKKIAQAIWSMTDTLITSGCQSSNVFDAQNSENVRNGRRESKGICRNDETVVS